MIGIIVRDYEGFVLAIQSDTKNILAEAVTVEALATLPAVVFN